MEKRDKALLLAVNSNKQAAVDSIDELEQLALAVDIITVAKVIQPLNSFDMKYYIGSGKVKEVKDIILLHEIDIVICDDTLSATQIRNLEEVLAVQIVDRSFLILQIFAARAKTRQAILEVSLAQKLYMLPRLIGMSKSLSRQGGGSFNAKGPGETKLELDRRKLFNEISIIKNELAIIKKERLISNKRRNDKNIKVVALVGYTNAGKSSLLNCFVKKWGTNKELVFEEDMLFATIDTKAKRIKRDNNPPFILIDTVGFISKLPTELITSFESTLNDILSADLIIHVVDGANPNLAHINFVRAILKRLKLDNIPRLLVLTKSDLNIAVPYTFDQDYLLISSKDDYNINTLYQKIEEILYKDYQTVYMRIPFDRTNIYQEIKENSTVLTLEHDYVGIVIKVILSNQLVNKYSNFIINKTSFA